MNVMDLVGSDQRIRALVGKYAHITFVRHMLLGGRTSPNVEIDGKTFFPQNCPKVMNFF